jgi:hypothetical protein
MPEGLDVMWHKLATTTLFAIQVVHSALPVEKKGRPVADAPWLNPVSGQGVRRRKNCSGWELLTGMELENVPVPLNVLWVFVVQADSRLVVVNKV